MLIRSLASIVIVVSSYVLVIGQASDAKKETANTTATAALERQRDVTLSGGVDMQFLIKELARELDLNVLFDPQSRLESRKVKIELKNVTTKAALDLLLLQEGLYSEEVGSKTILVSSRLRGSSIPQIGAGTTLLTNQLAAYFGVEGGILINFVRPDSPAAKAGLKAGDVIVGIDGAPVNGAVGLMRAIDEKKDSEFTLKIVRDRKEKTVSLRVTP